jgi:hypothetical protein
MNRLIICALLVLPPDALAQFDIPAHGTKHEDTERIYHSASKLSSVAFGVEQ